MNNIILQEYFIISLFCLICGFITEKIIYDQDKENETLLSKCKKKSPLLLATILILLGCLFHFFIEILGINKWQCSKKCYPDGNCELICVKNI